MSPGILPRGAAAKKIAIVGSGSAGLAAAWALRDTDQEIHLFEKSPRLGGHTNTQIWRKNEQCTPVDTGFIVLNTATYPNFIRFLDEVGIEPVETEMTFSVSRNHGEFEWSGEPQGIFAQRRNIFRARHWRLLFDIVRFNQFALDVLVAEHRPQTTSVTSNLKFDDMSIGAYLDQHGYSQAFRDDYLIPMTAAVWSTAPDKASLQFPARTLIRFLWNHHLLSTLAARPAWLTIPGGSQRYIDAIIGSFSKDRLHIHTSCEVSNILRPSSSEVEDVIISWNDKISGRVETDRFAHVILACHGDEILPILSDKITTGRGTYDAHITAPLSHDNNLSQTEIDVFSSFETTANTCYLHSDISLMPKRKKTWTSWNYLTNDTPDLQRGTMVSLTYNMNILQHIPHETFGHVLVTMNPDIVPDHALTQGKFFYRHPLYTAASVNAQTTLKSLQNTRRVSYCGAWTNYGFHEDAFSSGLRVSVAHLGARIPFELTDSTYSRGTLPIYGAKDYLLRAVLVMILYALNGALILMSFPGIKQIVQIVTVVIEAMLDVAEVAGIL